MRNTLQSLLIFFLILIFHKGIVFAEDYNIEVFSDKVIGEINPLIRGNAMVAYYIAGKDYKLNSNYGAGIWDPDKRRSVAEVVDLAKNVRISILRFPGGGQPDYNWKNTIGPTENRPNFLYGIDEFLETAEDIGSEVIYSFPYYIGSPQDAADLVEYLNSECNGMNPGGGIDWANERAKNGHAEPYNVKYFELGNEVNFGYPDRGLPAIDPSTYAKVYSEYNKAMKAIDPSVLLGAVTVNSFSSQGISAWNNELFEIAGSEIDFLIEHTYRLINLFDNNKNADLDRLFEELMSSIPDLDVFYKRLLEHFESVTGRKNIPIAVTEYNSGFGVNKPLPFRYSLGSALLNAGTLMVIMRPENNILMANFHQFVNSFFGAIKNDDFMHGRGEYIKRPNYYTLEIFSRYFGDELIDVRIEDKNMTDNPDSSKVTDLLLNIPWKQKTVFGADIDVLDDGTVKVGFNGKKDINFHHMLKRVSVKPNTTYLLSGYMKAQNIKTYEGVCLMIADGRGWELLNNGLSEKIWGTTGWIRVELEYTTSDTSNINVLIRRISGRGGPISGKLYVRDVKLTEKRSSKEQSKDNLMVSASIDKATNNLYIIVLNKSLSDNIRASIKINNSELRELATVRTLNGPDIWSLNETDPETVTIKEGSINMNSDQQIDHVFPAHSLTSIELNPMN